MASEEGEPVLLHVYDLSQGLARQLSGALLGQMLEGIWHTGVVVYGREYFFGGGIQTGRPGRTQYGNPIKTVPLGRTEVPLVLVEDFLNEIKDRYSVYTYNLMRHNCNHFSNELSTFLTGTGIPSDILELPQRVLSSPFGAMLAPLIEQMETGMRANDVPSRALFNPPPLDFASIRPPQVNSSANPQRKPLQNTSNPTPNPLPNSARTPTNPRPSSVAAAGTPSVSRPLSNLPSVGTPATPHVGNLSQSLQTPVAPTKTAPSPATAQELRALSSEDAPASTPGVQAGASLTGPRAAAAAAAEARAKLAAVANSNGRTVAGPVTNGALSRSMGSGKSLNVSREVVQKEVKAEFAEVMKEGKLTPNQAAAIALARVMERHSLESPTKKGARLATEGTGSES